MSIGICRFNNLGNTCYMNTVFQLMLHTKELSDILKNNRPTQSSIKRDEYTIMYYWKDIIHAVDTSSNIPIISPRSLIQSIHKLCIKHKRQAHDGTQQDAFEFLIYLMDIFHNAISRSANIVLNINTSGDERSLYIECYERVKQLYSTNYSEIIKIFYGMTVTEIIDISNSEILSRTFDPFFVLNVSILHVSEYISMHHCLDTIFGVELLENDNKWFNPVSKKYQDAIKKTQLWNIPSILMINIKKYTSTQKIHGAIDIPMILDISTYIHPYSNGHYIYQLYGVCNHAGDIHGGHYYAFVYVEAIHSWVVLNDDRPPCKISESQVITPNAVGVLYRICKK